MRKIFAIIFMLGFVFAANAEITKGKVVGNQTFYSVVNEQVNNTYFCTDTDIYSILTKLIILMGNPTYVISDNKQLNPEVAVITKRHRNSVTSFDDHCVLNTYDRETNTYQTYFWW